MAPGASARFRFWAFDVIITICVLEPCLDHSCIGIYGLPAHPRRWSNKAREEGSATSRSVRDTSGNSHDALLLGSGILVEFAQTSFRRELI